VRDANYVTVGGVNDVWRDASVSTSIRPTRWHLSTFGRLPSAWRKVAPGQSTAGFMATPMSPTETAISYGQTPALSIWDYLYTFAVTASKRTVATGLPLRTLVFVVINFNFFSFLRHYCLRFFATCSWLSLLPLKVTKRRQSQRCFTNLIFFTFTFFLFKVCRTGIAK